MASTEASNEAIKASTGAVAFATAGIAAIVADIMAAEVGIVEYLWLLVQVSMENQTREWLFEASFELKLMDGPL